MKKTLIILTICLIALFSWCLIGYSETTSDEENLSLVKAIQSELPSVFNIDSGFAASAGADFVANTPSLLASAGVVSSRDITLNRATAPTPSSGTSGPLLPTPVPPVKIVPLLPTTPLPVEN